MDQNSLRKLLRSVQAGRLKVDDALDRLRRLPFESLGFAHVDHHRAIRCGFPEVIFCPGKTVEQVRAIFSRLAGGGGNVLATRATEAMHQAVRREHPRAEYHALPRAITPVAGSG